MKQNINIGILTGPTSNLPLKTDSTNLEAFIRKISNFQYLQKESERKEKCQAIKILMPEEM